MKYTLSVSTIRKALDTLYSSTADLGGRSIGGAYAGIYSKQGAQTYGESTSDKLAVGEVFIHAKGSQTVGTSFLQSYQITGDTRFLDKAIEVGRALAAAQKPIGGWGEKFQTGAKKGSTDPTVTLDDDVTQGSLRFLMELDKSVNAKWLDTAIHKGLNFLVDYQAANGGWQQRYPARGDYHDAYTFNDSAIPRTLELLADAHQQYGDADYLAAVKTGAGFILRTQLGNGQAGWAQQYDHNLKPTGGRSFEPVGVASAETASIVKSLLAAYEVNKDARYLAAAQSAADWLGKSMLPSGEWARLYEIGSNRPIAATRDGNVTYELGKGASSYRWVGDFGIQDAIHQLTVLQVAPDRYDDIYGAGHGRDSLYKASSLESRASSLTRDFDATGWSTGSYIHSAKVADNAAWLQDYLRAAKGLFAGDGKAGLWHDVANGTARNVASTIHVEVKATVLFGETSSDRLTGSDGNDVLLGGAGKDTLSGSAGDDILVGGTGADTMDGDTGTDRLDYSISPEAVSVYLDRGIGERGDATGDKYANIEAVVGSRFADALDGNDGANFIAGAVGSDDLRGRGGNDTLSGGDGRDYLAGEMGRDVLTGGAGNDRFDFNKIAESPVGAGRDIIQDFAPGDLIDLVSIDANTRVAGNQAFAFIGNHAFKGTPGELRTVQNGALLLEGDVDGNRVADFQIRVDGVMTLTAADILL